jgi:hypothetical protein
MSSKQSNLGFTYQISYKLEELIYFLLLSKRVLSIKLAARCNEMPSHSRTVVMGSDLTRAIVDCVCVVLYM